MTKKLFLEPHYGDIAWSCGGLVAQNKDESIIVTIFPPRSKFYRFRLKRFVYRNKRKEEERFEELFGVKIIYLKYRSAFMRGRNLEALFDVELNDIEEKQVIELRKYITKIIKDENITEVYCPKAQRKQVDHLIVKKAVYGLIPDNFTVYYYEDFPNFIPKSQMLIDSSDMKEIRVNIENVIEEKIQAILLYESLVDPYFKSKETLVEFIRKTPFETFWIEK